VVPGSYRFTTLKPIPHQIDGDVKFLDADHTGHHRLRLPPAPPVPDVS
jgi:hypothetical protein